MSIHPAAGLGLAASLAVTAALVAPPVSASADGATSPTSFAHAQFLSGTLLGADLDGVVALDPASAQNDGGVPVVQEHHPLSITALDALTIAPGAIRVTGVDGVDVGVLGQSAVANDDGSSWAAVGAVGSDGAVAVGDGGGISASIDLASLLGDALVADIAQLRLDVVGIAAQAEAELGAVSGDSTIADLNLVVEVPAIAELGDRAAASLAPVEQSLAALAGPSGAIAVALDRALVQSGSVGILGTGASIDVVVDADLAGVVDGLRSGLLHDRALTIDLATGIVAVDLDALPSSPGINGLAPGSELLSAAVVDDIVSGVERLLDHAIEDVEVALRAAVLDASVSVAADLSVLESVQTGERIIEIPTSVTMVIDRVTGATLGTLDPATGVVTSLVPGIDGSDLRRLLDGAGGLLATLLGLTGGVTTKVVTTIETLVEPVISTLETGVSVRLNGTLAQVESSSASVSAEAVVLGTPIGLDAGLILGGLAGVVDVGGVLGEALDSLGDDAQAPATDAVAGDASPLAAILGDLVSIRVHLDEFATTAQGESYTRTALRVSVLDGALTTIDLAAATVGPNTAGSNGGGGGDDPGAAPNPGGWGGLAFTGAGLPWLALALALLLAGIGTAVVLHRRRVAALADADVSSVLDV